jgi:hypothetical protein
MDVQVAVLSGSSFGDVGPLEGRLAGQKNGCLQGG